MCSVRGRVSLQSCPSVENIRVASLAKEILYNMLTFECGSLEKALFAVEVGRSQNVLCG
jgi:hypothetical protein